MSGLLALVLAASLSGQVAAPVSQAVELNGVQVQLKQVAGPYGSTWDASSQDWGGHPPTFGPRTGSEGEPTGWYAVRVNGQAVNVLGRVDAAGRFSWRWDEQRGATRPATAMIAATDPRANGVNYAGLSGHGVRASDPQIASEVAGIVAGSHADDDPERYPVPTLSGLGLDWGKLWPWIVGGLAVVVAAGLCFLALVLAIFRVGYFRSK